MRSGTQEFEYDSEEAKTGIKKKNLNNLDRGLGENKPNVPLLKGIEITQVDPSLSGVEQQDPHEKRKHAFELEV